MRKRDWVALVVIWGVVLSGAVVLAAVFADDDPNTDEGSGAGALAAVVGGILTALWFVIRELRSPSRSAPATDIYRSCPHCNAQMSRFVRVCPHCRKESPPWVFQEGRWWTRTPDGRAWVLDESANEWRPSPASGSPP